MPRHEPPPADRAVPPPQAGDATAVPFETSLAELNDLVNRLESGTLGLSDSIGAYERGVTILKRLHEQLADVETRVRMLVRIDDQGRPVLEEIDDGSAAAGKVGQPAGVAATAEGETTEGEKGGRRATPAAPRTGRPRRLPGMDDAGQHG